MNHQHTRCLVALVLLLAMTPIPRAAAWTDQAHMAMGMAAGYARFQNCAAADLSHTVAAINGLSQSDEQAHFFNASEDHVPTIDDAYAQLRSIGQSRRDCPDGYLLGAILHTTRLCRARTTAGVYDDEYYAVLLHYVADLAEPLHMSIYDAFNRSHHFDCDDILSDNEAEYPVFAAAALADVLTVDTALCFETEEELLEAVITLAVQSHALGQTMHTEQRNITREEALLQVSRAATLGRAILRYCGKIR